MRKGRWWGRRSGLGKRHGLEVGDRGGRFPRRKRRIRRAIWIGLKRVSERDSGIEIGVYVRRTFAW